MEYDAEDYVDYNEDDEFDIDEVAKDKGEKTLKWQPDQPGAFAICRYQTNGHWQAAILLYWIKWRWKKKNKIKQKGKEWVVALAADWMKEAGLSEGEYHNYALPYLKNNDLIEVKSWKFSGVRQTWIRLKIENLNNEFDDDYSFYELRRNSDFSNEIIIDAANKSYKKKKNNFKKESKGNDNKIASFSEPPEWAKEFLETHKD